MNTERLTTCIKHLTVSGLSSVSARIKSSCNLTGNSFEMPNVSYTQPMHHIESPGSAVMYTFYLYNKLPENTIITADKLAEVFPWGFFSERQLQDIWDAQKVGGDDREGYTCIGAPDNMIDYLESWKD